MPQETIDHIVSLHEQARDTRNDTEIRRREIEGRLKRITELYKWGDLTKEAYLADRDRLAGELASLQTVNSYASHVARAATFLSDLPAAWADATPEQRNASARFIFQKVEVEDDRVAAVVPQLDFAPFFVLAENEMGWPDLATPDCQELSLAGGSDGDRLRERDVVTLPLIPFLHPARLLQSRQRSGVGRYATVAKRPRIPRERWSDVAARVQREGLRAVARDFEMSHETARGVVSRVERRQPQ